MRMYRRPFIKPHTLVGDVDWVDYTCRVDTFIEGGDVELGGRIQGPFLKGYRLMLTQAGRWSLKFDEETLAEGSLQNFDASRWHELKLTFRDRETEAFIDGKSLAIVSHHRRNGYLALASSYDGNRFDNLEISP